MALSERIILLMTNAYVKVSATIFCNIQVERMVVSQLALAHETEQLDQGCTVKLYTMTSSEEAEQHGEARLR